MTRIGSCHCGKIRFEVDGDPDRLLDCNCSLCRRRGGLLWFVPREAFRLQTAVGDLGTYTFNSHSLHHHFCPTCGIAPFSESADPSVGQLMVNARCVEGLDLASLPVDSYDGASR